MESNSSNNGKEKDEDSATKHVLDYYKKYSQNKELPKYFSGSSISYLPEIKEYSDKPDIIFKTDVDIVITACEENVQSIFTEEQDTSRASSAMSNRKLEWDNGADIGYDNCMDVKVLRKSSSLPLLTDIEQKCVKFGTKQSVSDMECPKTYSSNSNSSSNSNVKLVLLTVSSSSGHQGSLESHKVSKSSSSLPEEKNALTSSSSDSDSHLLLKNIVPSTSSSNSCSKQKVLQFVSNFSYLKKKIGLPDAHSTPKDIEGKQYDPEISNTSVVTQNKKKDGKFADKDTEPSDEDGPLTPACTEKDDFKKPKPSPKENNLKNNSLEKRNDNKSGGQIKPNEMQVAKIRNRQIINLSLTKPITVECISSLHGQTNKTSNKTKPIVKSQSTIGIQTDSISEKELFKKVYKNGSSNQNQTLIYHEYSESNKSIVSSTQTNSDVVSNSNSFKFVKNYKATNLNNDDARDKSLEEKDKGSKLNIIPIDEELASNLKRTHRTNDLRTTPWDQNSYQTSSSDTFLGNLISASQLDMMGEDISESVNLLHKLLKSKKYDPVTKKHYIKKLIQKLVQSKYLEESSTSSELFVPKNPKKNRQNCNNLPSTESSYEPTPKSALESNLPWYPANSKRSKLSLKRKNLEIKTFTQEILPKEDQSSKEEISSPPEIIPIESKYTGKNRFTLTNNEFLVNHESLYQEKDHSDNTQAYHKQILSSCKTNETSLDKQYESTSTSKSLSYQNWREDKTVSEKRLEKERPHSSNGNGDHLVHFADNERKYQLTWISNEISHLGKLKGLLEKPVVKQSKGSKAGTKIKNHRTVYMVSQENTQPNNSRKGTKLKRNYVIETQLSTRTSKPTHFQLDHNKYTVEKVNDDKADLHNKRRHILGDIQVISSDSTTNIKVTTFCEACKRCPCVCILECLTCFKYPCICEHSSACEMCNSIPCTCPSNFDRITCTCVCRICNKNPCVCSGNTLLTESTRTVCLLCHQAPCICTKNQSSSRICTICSLCPCICERGGSSKSTPTALCCYQVPCIGTVKQSTSRICSVCNLIPCICTNDIKISPSDEYAGMFISANFPKPDNVKRTYNSKCSVCDRCPCICAGSLKLSQNEYNKCISVYHPQPELVREEKNKVAFSDCSNGEREQLSLKHLNKCSVCEVCPCICKEIKENLDGYSESSTRQEIPQETLTISHNGSLKRVFENCTCSTKATCNCDFVEKLIRHFDKNFTSSSKHAGVDSETKDCQTEEFQNKCEYQQIGVQTNVDVKHQNLQTCKCPTENKLAQTEDKAQAVGVQTLTDAKHQNLQTDREKLRPDWTNNNKTSIEVQTKQTICHDGTTQIELVKCSKVPGGNGNNEKDSQTLAIKTDHHGNIKQMKNRKCMCDLTHDSTSKYRRTQTDGRNQNPGDQVKFVQTDGFSQTRSNQTDMNKQKTTFVCSNDISDEEHLFSSKAQRPRSSQYKDDILRTRCKCGGVQDKNEIVRSFTNSHSESSGSTISATKDSSTSDRITKEPTQTDSASQFRENENSTNFSSNNQYIDESRENDISHECLCTTASSSSGTYESVTNSSSSKLSSLLTCVCCKQKYPPERISMLGSKNQSLPLCHLCCQKRPILTSVCYTGPEHVCNCYKLVRSDVLNKIKNTTNELYDLHCTCTRASRMGNSEYCSYCQFRLKKTAQSRNGIAYTLTLEDESPRIVKSKRKRKKTALEEIRVKVPCPYNKKKHKEMENYNRKDSNKQKIISERIQENAANTNSNNNASTNGVKTIQGSKEKFKMKKRNLTLQEYLKTNRPDFIDSAEYRRQAVLNSKGNREFTKEDQKLRFLEENLHNNRLKKQNKLFTEHEMKEITKRNYKKLPEVQQKLNKHKELVLRNADRFIVDVFARKIQDCALKGKSSFPIDANIVSMSK